MNAPAVRAPSGLAMTHSGSDELSIFSTARQIADPAARKEYLASACGPDQTLRARIQILLDALDEQQSFLNIPADQDGLTIGMPAPAALPERPGSVIGHYKILQQIGEGGMAVVFLADQTPPIQRKVALKIINPGMDSRHVIARFQAERQALALMDHPNIAKVLDAGTTASGGPYFVMELVKGVPMTRYCDEHHLAPRARLELFLQVCQAVQH